MKKKEQSTFVKLTKKDGLPVWINASYVVTVEPSRFGGSVVVPIGDGLDYDVRETPEAVIEMVTGAPVPAVVPVPPPAAIPATKTKKKSAATDDTAALVEAALAAVIPPASAEPAEPEPAVEEPPKKKRATRKTKAEKEAEEAAAAEGDESAAKPAKKTKSRAKKAAAAEPEEEEAPAAEEPPPAPPAPRPVFNFPDDYLVRLRKLAPGSIRKFKNTLLSQFKIDDPEPVMLYLVDRRIITLEKDHIVWLPPDPASIPENVADLVVG